MLLVSVPLNHQCPMIEHQQRRKKSVLIRPICVIRVFKKTVSAEGRRVIRVSKKNCVCRQADVSSVYLKKT